MFSVTSSHAIWGISLIFSILPSRSLHHHRELTGTNTLPKSGEGQIALLPAAFQTVLEPSMDPACLAEHEKPRYLFGKCSIDLACLSYHSSVVLGVFLG
jgi:hypothetical protein